MINPEWALGQRNLITLTLIDSFGVEVTGLGSTFDIYVAKTSGTGMGALNAGAGDKGEIGMGGYWYYATAAEANTPGPVYIVASGAGTIQQNLEYIVESRAISSIEFTYTITDSVSGNPIEGVQVWIAMDTLGTNIIWSGDTDASGVARDDNNSLPRLDPGTYYFFRQKSGYTFSDPDTEVVS